MRTGSRDHALGPEQGSVLARTSRSGPAAGLGHDLLLEFTRWHAALAVDEDGSGTVEGTVQVASLEVREGTGGAMPLSDGDRRDIRKTAQRLLDADRHPDIHFTATGVVPGDSPITIEGRLTVAGRQAPITLSVDATAPGTYRVTGSVLQSDHGIKPYSAFLGALRLRDAVDVEIVVALPREE